jgi:beta-lactam-binding protein with PASTA domain
VPSVFGLTTDQAVGLLEERGLDPRVETRATCNEIAGRAMSTTPSTGTLVSAGDVVTITTPDPGARCLVGAAANRELAWKFLDFAAGRGEVPPVASEVTVYDGDDPTTLSHEQAADPDSWPAVGDVRAALTEVQRLTVETRGHNGVAFPTPALGVRASSGSACGDRPAGLRGRSGLALSIAVPSDGVGPIGRCLEVTLFRIPSGAIDAVLVTGRSQILDVPGPPDVVGNSVDYASERLESAGYQVDEVARPDCGQVGTVAAQTPDWGEPVEPGSTVILGVVEERTQCNNSEFTVPTPFTRAADALIAFARGDGGPPTVADAVTVYVDDHQEFVLFPEEAADPDAWDHVLDRLRDPVAQSEGAGVADDRCIVRHEMPDDLADANAWRLSVPEPAECSDDWSLLLWLDDTGAIRAVDLLRGGPALPETQDLAHQFDDFALGTGDLPPIGDEVDLYVGGAFTGFVTKDSATDRTAWETCTETGTYAGRDCPFSPLQVLRREGGAVELVAGIGRTCLPTFDHPGAGIESADSVMIVPTNTGYGMCLGFAVQLYVNDDGELIAVDLLLPKKE